MKDSYFTKIMCASIIIFASSTANARLFDRGGGLIYDDETDLTWMQNANVMGKMSVQKATEWVENLVYEGLDDWRLPTTLQFDDPSCLEDTRHIPYAVFYERHHYCTNGEMEDLSAKADPYSNPIFYNVQRSRYWTSTPYRDGVDPCVEGDYCTKDGDNGIRKGFFWQWDFERSVKATLSGGNSRYAWAVRDGDVNDTAPPPPPEEEEVIVDPEIAIGEVTTNIFIPSFDDGSGNISINFIYYGLTPDQEDLYVLQKNAANSPEIIDANNGIYTSTTQIHLPSVNYRALFTNLNIWMDLVHYGFDEDGNGLWKVENYGENLE